MGQHSQPQDTKQINELRRGHKGSGMCPIAIGGTFSLFTATQECLRVLCINFEPYRREGSSFMASVTPWLFLAEAAPAPGIGLPLPEGDLERLFGRYMGWIHSEKIRESNRNDHFFWAIYLKNTYSGASLIHP